TPAIRPYTVSHLPVGKNSTHLDHAGCAVFIQQPYSDFKSKMYSRRRELRRRSRTNSTLRSRRRANEEDALIWNWNYSHSHSPRGTIICILSNSMVAVITRSPSSFNRHFSSAIFTTLESPCLNLTEEANS